jgi:pyruvate carboxylase
LVRDYSDVSVLPTPAFFYGLKPGEEISVDIEEGKTLFIKLSHLGERWTRMAAAPVTFELNGMTREVTVWIVPSSPRPSAPQSRPGRPVASRRAHSRP